MDCVGFGAASTGCCLYWPCCTACPFCIASSTCLLAIHCSLHPSAVSRSCIALQCSRASTSALQSAHEHGNSIEDLCHSPHARLPFCRPCRWQDTSSTHIQLLSSSLHMAGLLSLQTARLTHVLLLDSATSGARRGTLHIILTEELGPTLVLSTADKKRLPHAAACIAHGAPTDLIEEVNSGTSNSRSITAAVIAQMASLDSSVAQTGLGFLVCLPSCEIPL